MTDETELAADDRRPRLAVVWYGSLLAPEEMRDVSADVPDRAVPVKVEGFRRTLDQESSWRGGDGKHRGVATVARDPDSWFNGVLVADLDRAAFERYREREEGYTLVEVRPGAIEPYDGDRADVTGDLELVLVAEGDKRREDIEPKRTYRDLCLAGARHWGEEFYDDFLATTEGTSSRKTNKKGDDGR